MTDLTVIDTLFDSPPSRRDLSATLDRLPLPADAKVLMGQLLATTAAVAGQIIEVGRQIIAFVLEMVRRYPATALGAVVGLTITVLIGSIPLLGFLLGPLIGPIMTAFLLTQGALSDMRNLGIAKEIEALERKFDLVLRNA